MTLHAPPALGRWLARCTAPAEHAAELDADLCDAWARRQHLSFTRRHSAFWRDVLSIALLSRRLSAIRVNTSRRSALSAVSDLGGFTVLQNIRLALRTIQRQPGAALITVATMAIGIGASTTVFSLVYGVWLKPLPYTRPAELVLLDDRYKQNSGGGTIALPEAADFARAPSLDAVVPFAYSAMIGSDADGPRRIVAFRVGPRMFSMLGVRPALGRDFIDADGTGENGAVTILSDRFWRKQYGANPAVIGQTLAVTGMSATIIGVMPRGFRFPNSDVWLALNPNDETRRSQRFYQAIARMKSDRTILDVESDLQKISSDLSAAFPDTNAEWTTKATSIVEDTFSAYRTPFGMLLGAVGLLMAIACANIASVYLARSAAREADFAVRSALGASRWQLAQQMIVESVVIASIGGALGVLAANAAVPVLADMLPRLTPRIADLEVDRAVLAFSVAVSMLAGILCGLAPAVRLSRPPADRLRERTRGTLGPGRLAGRSGLVVAEVALALVLLVGGGLMMRSFFAVLARDRGFDPSQMLVSHVVIPFERYKDNAARVNVMRTMQERIAAIPSVERVGAVTGYPNSSLGNLGVWVINNTTNTSERIVAGLRAASSGYFAAMKAPLVAGRAFEAADEQTHARVLVVNRTLADRLWPGESAVGRQLVVPQSASTLIPADGPYTVVGVVADLKMAERANPELFVPLALSRTFWMDIVIRTSGDPAALTSVVRSALKDVEPNLLLEDMMTMDRVVTMSVAWGRTQSSMVALLAGMAALLAAVGVYGLISYSVAERIPEIGLRLALGASPIAVLRRFVLGAISLSVIGVAIGGAVAALLVRALQSEVFGLKVIDPWVVTGAPLVLIAAATLAAYVPARRALRVDPALTLRR